MPQQQIFFEQMMTNGRIEVLKTYDQNYAHEVFGSMDEAAQSHLWNSLEIEENFDPGDIPPQHDPDTDEFLWEALLDAAREDGQILSFFVVNEARGNRSQSLYVSPDWPSAEAFARQRIIAVQ
jgi:hypothetical protein